MHDILSDIMAESPNNKEILDNIIDQVLKVDGVKEYSIVESIGLYTDFNVDIFTDELLDVLGYSLLPVSGYHRTDVRKS